jgi:hypothetical protein
VVSRPALCRHTPLTGHDGLTLTKKEVKKWIVQA